MATLFTDIDFAIKREIENYIQLTQTLTGVLASDAVGSWKETQSDEDVLHLLKNTNETLRKQLPVQSPSLSIGNSPQSQSLG